MNIRWQYLMDAWRMTGTLRFPKFVMSLAKLHRRLLTKRGRGLARMLPLNMPLNVQIDPANACNFRCTYCPTGDDALLKEVGRPTGVMDYKLFTKLIDDISKFPEKIEELHLYKDGEPLLNRRIGDMIAYAKKKDVAHRIIMTSNCAMLFESKADEILNAGLDVLRVSVEHVNDEGYKKITQTYGDYGSIIKNVGRLYHEKKRRGSKLHIHAKIVDAGLTPEEKRKFYDDFSSISDSAAVETIMGWSNPMGRDFKLGQDPQSGISGVYPLKRERKVCPSPFYMLSVNWNGRVSVCCVDWSMDTIVGDASKESLLDIWDSPALNEFRLKHLRGEKDKIKACQNCHFVQGFLSSDDIDAAAEKLMPLYHHD